MFAEKYQLYTTNIPFLLFAPEFLLINIRTMDYYFILFIYLFVKR